MMRAGLLFALASVACGGTVIDQIAVVVGKHAIKTSDIDRDLRVTEFLNGQTPVYGVAERRASAQRLIDQELIRADLAQRGSTTPPASDAKAVLDRLVADKFHGSQEQMIADLRRRGLTQMQVMDELQWQLVVLRFIDQRFRAGVSVSDSDLSAYYGQHAAELKQQHPGADTLAALTPAIREQLEGDRINRSFEDWLQEARQMASIDYKLAEYKPGEPK